MDIIAVNLDEQRSGYPQRDMPDIMAPGMMRKLLGGKFPDTGFAWEYVKYFKYEEGIWEPYNCYDEILPAPGFIVEVEVVDY